MHGGGGYRNFGLRGFRAADAWGNRHNRALDEEMLGPNFLISPSLTFYANYGYEQVNDYLRGKGKFTGIALEDSKSAASDIDKILSNSPLQEDVVVYRGVGEKFFNRLKVGKTFKDKAFISTTLVRGRLEPGFHKGELGFDTELIIKVPSGTGAYYIGNNFIQGNEYELLLERGLRFEVEEINSVTKTAVVKVTP